MKFWLILKQSFRSFYSKIGLYLTFTIFLIISLAMIIGLFGFSYGYEHDIKDTLGRVRLNQRYDFGDAYLPRWVVVDQESEANINRLDPGRHFFEQEVDNKVTNFLLNQFPEAFPPSDGPYDYDNLAHPQHLGQLRLALVSLGIGYSWGDLSATLEEDNVSNNQLLFQYFSQLSIGGSGQDNIQQNLALYNQFIRDSAPNFSRQYLTTNVPLAIFLSQFANTDQNYLIASGFNRYWKFASPLYTDPGVSIKYQRLNVNSNLVRYKPELRESTPKLLFSNDADPFNIVSELSIPNLSSQRAFLDDYRYTYVAPKFLHKYHLRLGDRITLFHSSDPETPVEFLIVGTMAETFLFNQNSAPIFTIPYQWAERYQVGTSKLSQIFTPYVSDLRLYNPRYKGDLVTAQRDAAELFMSYFIALRSEDQARFYTNLTSTKWTVNSLQGSYEMTTNLFYVLATVLSILIIILLFVVFYFITREIINMERNTLFYLKAMGVYNSGLSLLTTFALIVPIIIGIIGGLFVGLAIQKMISEIALSSTVLDWSYWKFDLAFILALVISILIIFSGFYLINFRFLRSPSLIGQTTKNPGILARGLIHTKAKVDDRLSREVRLTLAFAFKNIYKNIVTFFILAITFGLILYIVQFQSSLNAIANAYEKWNQPYQSVLYQPQLLPFITDASDYQRSYEVIKENQLPELQGINTTDDLKKVIADYNESLASNQPFNWTNFYITKVFTKQAMAVIGDNPSDEQINNWIDEFYEEADYQVRGQIIAITKEITKQNKALRDQFGYNDGYNLFFGRVVIPNAATNRDVLVVDTTFYEHYPAHVKSILFENDAVSRQHYDFATFTTAESYIQRGTFTSTIVDENKLPIRVKDPLRVKISAYLQTNYNIHLGDVVPIRLEGFKTNVDFDGYQGDNSALIYGYVSGIVRGDTVENNFFSSQIGVVKYLAEGNHELAPVNPELISQQEYYDQLLQAMETDANPLSLSNTIYTANQVVPFGLRNITLPLYAHTDSTKPIGSRIEDFYSKSGKLQQYLTSFGDNISIFHLVTLALLGRTDQFIAILWRFVIILTLFALIVSLLLVTLVLLENRRIISVLKALGYRRSEITGYLITGYLLSTILAVIASIGLSFLAFFLTRKPISKYLQMSVYYLFSWQFFLLAIFLGVIFASLMAVSIAVFTRFQKPKDAFVGG